MIAAQMRGRLASLGVPVLLPHEVEAIVNGQKPGQKRGVPGYLSSTAPDGYVQIEQPLAIGTDSLAGTFWVAVAAIADTPERALELGLTVRRLLNGWNYAPGPYRETTPGHPLQLEPGAWLYRATYEAKTLDGESV